jgi:serine/threonine protein kinase
MITSTGHLKLIDFGLSKDEMIPASDCSPSQSEKIPRVDPRNKRRPSALTWQRNSLDSLDTEGMPDFFSPNKRHMSLVGSPEYMAVEMVLGEEYSHLVDYWSAGVILYELVSGTAPFAGETPQKVFDKIR